MNRAEALQHACIDCLNYFAVFRHPLTAAEVHSFISVSAGLEEVKDCLEMLCEQGIIARHKEYFMPVLHKDWVSERLAGKERALALLQQSGWGTRIIATFPFVDGIAISGSLSKWYAGKQGDVDYFIITRSHRLWIARTLLHIFKKLTFLTGSQHYFCMNYFVDRESLTICHQNQYTAIEVATLIPVYNAPLINAMKAQNTWIHSYLPNYTQSGTTAFMYHNGRAIFKSLSEKLLNLLFPRSLNRLLMKLTAWRWRRKWRNNGYTPEAFQQAFMSTPHISKNHPVDYERKVLKALEVQLVETGRKL